ncbi:MAG: DUF6765 family protein [Desulfomonilia bacterium]
MIFPIISTREYAHEAGTMQIDAHYYALLAFLRACGFKKPSALKVAYASQYVDDAKLNHVVIEGDPNTITHDTVEGKACFFNMATCHSYTMIKTINYTSMVHNTCAFHFVPGCKGANFVKRMRCRTDSPVIRAILEDAMAGTDLIKLGIALHAYADSYSHHGFSGLISKVNDIRDCRAIYGMPADWKDTLTRGVKFFIRDKLDAVLDMTIPAYGHGQALDYPDIPSVVWSYEYDYSDEFSDSYIFSGMIDNRKRFAEAFQAIRGYLERFLAKHRSHRDRSVPTRDFATLFETLVHEAPRHQRIEDWRELILNHRLFDHHDEFSYDEHAWPRSAFENYREDWDDDFTVEGARLSQAFSGSAWYAFYLAVKWYKRRFFQYCSHCGLDIPR